VIRCVFESAYLSVCDCPYIERENSLSRNIINIAGLSMH